MLSCAMAAKAPKLYALPASHPCEAVQAALRLKGIEFRRVDMLPLTQIVAGPLLFGGITVPGMRVDGERIVGSRAIMRKLDAIAPDPPLLPPAGDPLHERVLDAERWGDEVFQPVPRRLIDAAWLRRPHTMLSYAAGAKLPLPLSLLRPAAPLTAKLMALRNDAKDANARADLAALPQQLARIDGWIAEGLLGGERPNAADLQIGSTIRLLLTIGDVRPLIEVHAATALTRYFPPQAGEVPAGTLPQEWLAASAPS